MRLVINIILLFTLFYLVHAQETSSTVISTATRSASSPAPTSTTMADCRNAEFFSTRDFFPNKLDFSKLDPTVQFNVTYYNTFKVVHNMILDEYYVLYCTASAPDLGSTFQSKTYIQIPTRSFAAIDTRALGYLDLLGQSDTVVYVGDTNNVTSPCSSNAPLFFNETDTSLNRTMYDLAIYPNSENNDPKGIGLGLGYSTTPLNNAQWIKYISLFTNQETQADAIYDDIMADYVTFRNSINAMGAVSYRRNITFMEYNANLARFNIYQDAYFSSLTSDAGGTLQLFNQDDARPSSPIVMKERLQNASLVIDLTPETVFNSTFSGWQSWMGYSNDGIQAAAESAFNNYLQTRKYVNSYDAPPFARSQELWRLDLNSRQGALDYWTRGMARPDLVLLDMIQAQYPDFISRNRTFFRAFGKEEKSSSGTSVNYQCNLNNWVKASSVSYQNSTSDRPVIPSSSNKLPLSAIIGLSVVGGLVGLACLATSIVLAVRKFKNGWGRRFHKLDEEQEKMTINSVQTEVLLEHHHETKKTITVIST